jgi:NADH:ubiquinone oxidoreductase subunit H
MKILLEYLPSYISAKKLSLLFFSFFSYIDKIVVNCKIWIVSTWSLLITTYGVEATIMSIKFLLSIALLIFIRGGIPRYRFDHLTRIGWVKFLTLVVCFLLIELTFIYTIMS